MNNLEKAFALFLFLLPSILIAEEADDSDWLLQFDKMTYTSFKTIRSFATVQAFLQGDANKNGLNKSELTDYLRLRLKNNLAGFPYKEMTNEKWQAIAQDASEFPEFGSVWLHVWVVGNDYPLALHISLEAGSFKEQDQYTNAILGVTTKSHLDESVKSGIDQLVERFAATFFKVRGEL